MSKKSKTKQRRPETKLVPLPKASCRGCKSKIVLTAECDVTVMLYPKQPLLDGLCWSCPTCGFDAYVFFGQWSEVANLKRRVYKELEATTCVVGHVNSYMRKQFAKTFGYKLLVPREAKIGRAVKSFRAELNELVNVEHFKALT